MHVLGTAGHVDHGKSALVRALTGTDPDRFIEERLRGMTLDLGFAHLRFPDGVEAGVVDVPGHERFLHNMLAGAAGMELLLLVVAANESPKPQTLEHLAILRHLNVRRTLIVLTKIDLLAADDVAAASARVRAALSGTLAGEAPVFPVSVVSGAGLDALRTGIHAELRALPPRAPDAPAYLPIDRVFALSGHGTIVTGTLMQGRIAVGDTLLLTPLEREVRVRSLQVFGVAQREASGGARVAVNLPGIETQDVARGAVLATRELVAASAFDVTFLPQPDALGILRRRTPVRAYAGSAEILGTLVFAAVPERAEPVAARLVLRTPLAAPRGATFVVRRVSPKDLLGGGTLTPTIALAETAQHRSDDAVQAQSDDSVQTRSNDSVQARINDGAVAPLNSPAEAEDAHPAENDVVAALAKAGLDGATPAAVDAAANVREAIAADILAALLERGRAYRLSKPAAFVDAECALAALARIEEALASRHDAAPWSMGLTMLGLSRTLGIPEARLTRIGALFAEEGRLAHRAGYFALPAFGPQLSPEQLAFFELELVGDAALPFAPASLSELVAHVKASRVTGVMQALDMLFAAGTLVKVGDDVYRSAQIREIQRRLEEQLRRDRTLTMAAFRDLVGTSRKHAVPLLERFDATGVTVRSGDLRMLRDPAKSLGTAPS